MARHALPLLLHQFVPDRLVGRIEVNDGTSRDLLDLDLVLLLPGWIEGPDMNIPQPALDLQIAWDAFGEDWPMSPVGANRRSILVPGDVLILRPAANRQQIPAAL